MTETTINPANIYVTAQNRIKDSIFAIQADLVKQIEFLKDEGKHLEAKRIEDRVTYDLEMIRELGYCSGIENYSRYFDGRLPGTRPFCLLDYFPKDYIMVIDESHVTVPQIGAMYGGDRARKVNLVDSAMDNRPLKFEEFQSLTNQLIYVSATPADYELKMSDGVIVEQLIRPTGVIDPAIEVRPSANQVDDLMEEIEKRVALDERVLVTTLTKRMAEELSKYFTKMSIRCRYIHSEVDTLERVEILRDLRIGKFDVLIGVNLLREGLDLPEVSLVAILDADKEGFLRNVRSLTQTVGRAARNINGRVIFYADKMTKSMKQTIDETDRRREKQTAYNLHHGIVPTALMKSKLNMLGQVQPLPDQVNQIENKIRFYESLDNLVGVDKLAADPVVNYMSSEQLTKAISHAKKSMEKAAKDLDFMEAAKLRDEYYNLQKIHEAKFKK